MIAATMPPLTYVLDRPSGPVTASVLALHKTGEDAEDAVALARAIFAGASIVAPRGTIMDGGRRRFFERHEDGSFDIESWRRSGRDIADLVTSLRQRDHSPKPVLCGLSHGANTALACLATAPELFAGVVLLRPAGRGMISYLPPLQGLPLFIANGREDTTVVAAESQALVAALGAAGAQVELFAVDAGHAVTDEDISHARRWAGARSW